MDDARERFEEGRLRVVERGILAKHIGLDDRSRQPDVLRVGTEHHRIHDDGTEVLLLVPAVVAGLARRRRRRHDRVPLPKAEDVLTGPGDVAGELVAEQRRHRHLGVAAEKRLQIGPARKRRRYAYDHLAGTRLGGFDFPVVDLAGFQEKMCQHEPPLPPSIQTDTQKGACRARNPLPSTDGVPHCQGNLTERSCVVSTTKPLPIVHCSPSEARGTDPPCPARQAVRVRRPTSSSSSSGEGSC